MKTAQLKPTYDSPLATYKFEFSRGLPSFKRINPTFFLETIKPTEVPSSTKNQKYRAENGILNDSVE